MNYLAHAVLSFGHPKILVGNMISDTIKGNKKLNYTAQVQKGIELHRKIDYFTDTHHIVKQAKSLFSKHYRLYSGAIVDVAFDHFLANHTNEFAADEDLYLFSQNVYTTLEQNKETGNIFYDTLFYYMRLHNWLYEGRKTSGIEKSFYGLQKRAKYISEIGTAIEIFHVNYQELKSCFVNFWDEVKPYTYAELMATLHNTK